MLAATVHVGNDRLRIGNLRRRLNLGINPHNLGVWVFYFSTANTLR